MDHWRLALHSRNHGHGDLLMRPPYAHVRARSRSRIGVAPAVTVLSLLLRAESAHATPPSTYEFGSRASALAGAVTADGGDFSSVYYNPAGLVRARAVRIDLGYLYAHHALYTNGSDNAVDPAHGVVGGVVAPGRLYGVPFAFGLADNLGGASCILRSIFIQLVCTIHA